MSSIYQRAASNTLRSEVPTEQEMYGERLSKMLSRKDELEARLAELGRQEAEVDGILESERVAAREDIERRIPKKIAAMVWRARPNEMRELENIRTEKSRLNGELTGITQRLEDLDVDGE